MSDSKEEVFKYQNEKFYTSNIVDIIVALATVTNVTIAAYYLDRLTVKNHVFKPTQKQSIANIELCFINGHYDLIVDATVQAELEYEKVLFLPKISRHQQKKLFKNLHHQKLNIPYNSFQRHSV